jgi:tryptophan-rich sensory protein
MTAKTTAKARNGAPVWLPIAAALGCVVAWLLGGMLTRPNLDWYATLAKPPFAPPNSVFPIVWPILYVLMAVSAWVAWKAPAKEEDRRIAFAWFFIQLGIGVIWSYAFFWMHSPFFGLVVIMALLVAIAITIVYFDRLSRIAALLLVPLLLWVCFAAGLNAAFWLLNG